MSFSPEKTSIKHALKMQAGIILFNYLFTFLSLVRQKPDFERVKKEKDEKDADRKGKKDKGEGEGEGDDEGEDSEVVASATTTTTSTSVKSNRAVVLPRGATATTSGKFMKLF
jgi:hypothetical protein